ncbi:hypothetical protein [uncultured Ferrovibrio sp.]|jgi:Uncharacterized protein conserved in bacteria|uniref:hypothetical protein n=1 Tax=uncultured Ferrovibrio sp. TaxID=1576913 RepID=UPI00263884D3|nr:hypothetical protein [uncultured Ferrovibrio sp.]
MRFDSAFVRSPQRLARWMYDNTGLSFDQIAEYCGLHSLEIRAIANGEFRDLGPDINPLFLGMLSQAEITRCESDVTSRLALRADWLSKPPQIDSYTEADTDSDDRVISADVVKLFYLYYGRNAWHSTWTEWYREDGSFHVSYNAACDAAERWRVQGSTFYLTEIPALSFRSNGLTILVFQTSNSDRLDQLDREPGIAPHYAKALYDFWEDLPDWILVKAMRGNYLLPQLQPGQTLQSYKSEARPGQMKWHPRRQKPFDGNSFVTWASIYNRRLAAEATT